MATLQELIESEVADFFAGFGGPGEPEAPEDMQSQLLSRIVPLLSSMEQEPVAWIVHAHGGDQLTSDGGYVANAEGMGGIHSTPLYAAPQLPQPAVPDAISTRQAISKMEECKPCDSINVAYKYGWNACRAAMLQGADGEPTDDERIMAIEGIIPVADLSEATVQGWIPCSERMPEEIGRYWCYIEEQNSLGKSHYQWNCSWNGDRWWVESENGGRVTHWMALPAAPQQEVKP